MIEFHGKSAKDGKLLLSQSQYLSRQQFLSSLKKDSKVIETLRKEGKLKTWGQCKMHFGLALTAIVDEFDSRGWDCSMLLNLPEPTGIGVDKDMLQIFFYALFPTLNDEGSRITLRKMDTEQESAFYDKIVCFASSQWQIYVPEPNPNWRMENAAKTVLENDYDKKEKD